MPEFAKHIDITRHGRRCALRIDGIELPWYIGEKPTVTLSGIEDNHATIDRLNARLSAVREAASIPEG
jgi:hypothetical protein